MYLTGKDPTDASDMNGGWDWLRTNWVVLAGLIAVGVLWGSLEAQVKTNSAAAARNEKEISIRRDFINEIPAMRKELARLERKVSRVLCNQGELSECVAGSK